MCSRVNHPSAKDLHMPINQQKSHLHALTRRITYSVKSKPYYQLAADTSLGSPLPTMHVATLAVVVIRGLRNGFTALQLCSRGIAMSEMPVRPSVRLSNVRIVTKQKKLMATFLCRMKERSYDRPVSKIAYIQQCSTERNVVLKRNLCGFT